MTDPAQGAITRSRRALLAAAAAGAAAVAATAVAPMTALAADPNDVVKDTDNATTALTSITQGTADTDAFRASGSGSGAGVIGATDSTLRAGVVGVAGDITGSEYEVGNELDAGVYGFAAQSPISAGVYGEGPTGVYGWGDYALYADGGAVGVFASATPSGTAVHAHAGTGMPPASTANTALMGSVTSNTQIGVIAYGRVVFPRRSGRVTFSAGQSSKAVTVSGMTSGNFAYAVLNTSRTGVYVRAVVPAAGKITIYLSKAPTASTSVAWLVLG